MDKSTSPIDYPKGLTFEQVWASIQELGKKYDTIFEREAKERQKTEEERRKAETEHQKAEAERQKAEAERRKEVEERLKKLEEAVKQASRTIEQTGRYVKQTLHSINETNKKVGHLDLRFGELIEHLIAPGVADRFKEVGYHFDDVTHPFGFKFMQEGNVIAQADILLENPNTILVIEIKAKPNIKDIQELEKKMDTIRKYYENNPTTPNNKELVGALAGAIFPKNVKQLAVQSGFFVITQKGDTVKIDVPKDFKPRNF
ncbi:MAG: hypothetical protein LBU34_13595 [Planctomycetaceae bacterium]|jgi:hypothetical protein|nr:hypothetical protein [Planctomycetaceae bacterium]